MKPPRYLLSLLAAIGLGLLAGVFYGAGGAHADSNNIYGNSASECTGALVINQSKSAAVYTGTGAFCVHLSSDNSTYVTTAAPSGSKACPDKTVVAQLGPSAGLDATVGGKEVCVYFKASPQFKPFVVNPGDNSGGCTAGDPNCASTLGQNATKTNCSNGSGGTISIATPGLTINCSGGKNPIFALLQFAVNWIIRLLGVLAVIAIIVSGIQYIVSQGNPDGIKKAKSRLTNAVVGLILLSLMFVILRILGIG